MALQPPRLGPGAIYLRSLDGLFRSNADLINVAEIEPQTLWTKATASDSVPRGSRGELRYVCALPQRLLAHGVGYPVAGTTCDQERHISEFRLWSEELAAPWVSEHLSILDVRGARGSRNCGFLMPPLQTEKQVTLAAHNIKNRQKVLGRPFAFETGVNYFSPRDFEMSDGEFFAAVADTADCGILLDLTNLWVNDRNGRAKIGDVLAKLPLERVWEVHLAGIEFAHGHWLDAHSGRIDPELVSIAAETVASLPNLGAIIFEIAADRVASFGPTAFLRQMETLHELWDVRMKGAAVTPKPAAEPVFEAHDAPAPESWECLIAKRMLPAEERPGNSCEELQVRAEDEQSFSLYGRLVSAFRAGTIAEMLENTTRLLLLGIGETALRVLIDRYVATTLPAAFPTDEALNFRCFLDAHPISVPGLKEILKFEATLLEAAANNIIMQVTLPKDIEAILIDIAAGKLPRSSEDLPVAVFEIGVDAVPFIRILDE
ncbi:MAG TPA: DUF692 family multinuclear iron-containing protein [Candidatus Angelobacter sp.]